MAVQAEFVDDDVRSEGGAIRSIVAAGEVAFAQGTAFKTGCPGWRGGWRR